MAFNEEANIRFLLESLLNQRLYTCEIAKIIVVASGCTDKTEKIVESIADGSNNLVELVVQERREGKASAINLFLSRAKGDVAIIESGDTIPEENTIENLVRPFHDLNVGMTGAHPIPVNSNGTFMAFTVRLFWRLHHELALNHPKLGELIAFRNIVREIPKNTAVDEASIEAIITEAGYRIHYVKDAIVHNKGAETITDFLKQRRRIMVGHKHLQMTRDYTVSTMKIGNLFGLFNRLLRDEPWNFRSVFWTCGALFLEFFGRLLGDYDYYIKKKNPFAWDIAQSTKNLKNDPTLP
ncbi:MAG: glycosyltransferase [Thermodesulfobacteriota bacterium]|nr:glycosyltransferase [Thermodesulfobacteriota bacterium]